MPDDRTGSGLTRVEYVVHDFDILNRHVEESLVRVRQLKTIRRLDAFQRIAKYMGVACAGLALLAVAGGFGYWLAFAPPNPEPRIVQVEKIIEKPVVIEPPSGASGSSKEMAAIAEALSRLTPGGAPPAPSSGPPPKEVMNFTLFTTVVFAESGLDSVVTGAKFDSAKDQYPSHQYCYVEAPLSPGRDGAGRATKSITIAMKVGKAPIDYDVIDRNVAEAAGTSFGVLKKAQGSCRFRQS